MEEINTMTVNQIVIEPTVFKPFKERLLFQLLEQSSTTTLLFSQQAWNEGIKHKTNYEAYTALNRQEICLQHSVIADDKHLSNLVKAYLSLEQSKDAQVNYQSLRATLILLDELAGSKSILTELAVLYSATDSELSQLISAFTPSGKNKQYLTDFIESLKSHLPFFEKIVQFLWGVHKNNYFSELKSKNGPYNFKESKILVTTYEKYQQDCYTQLVADFWCFDNRNLILDVTDEKILAKLPLAQSKSHLSLLFDKDNIRTGHVYLYQADKLYCTLEEDLTEVAQQWLAVKGMNEAEKYSTNDLKNYINGLSFGNRSDQYILFVHPNTYKRVKVVNGHIEESKFSFKSISQSEVDKNSRKSQSKQEPEKSKSSMPINDFDKFGLPISKFPEEGWI